MPAPKKPGKLKVYTVNQDGELEPNPSRVKEILAARKAAQRPATKGQRRKLAELTGKPVEDFKDFSHRQASIHLTKITGKPAPHRRNRGQR